MKKKFKNQIRWRMREKHQRVTPEAQTINGYYQTIFIKLDQVWFKFDYQVPPGLARRGQIRLWPLGSYQNFGSNL